MEDIYKHRLLNVAKALRESPNPEDFDMTRFTHCGTPACALGHYAARPDLQQSFSISASGLLIGEKGLRVSHDGCSVMSHFGLTADEAEDLFGMSGCEGAMTTDDAASYIEHYASEML